MVENFENHEELVDCFCCSGRVASLAQRQKVKCVHPPSIVRPLSKNCQKYGIFGLSSTVCQLDRKSCLAAATLSNHTILNFGQFLKFLRMYVFLYGLLFMVSREEAMDQSLITLVIK